MNNKTIILIVLATFFGLLSGITGQIISRAYFLEKDFNMPFFGDIRFANDNNDTNLIIRNPKKIVVEEETKARETKQSVQGSIMGIFLKKNNINLNKKEGDAFVITSDGWMISSFTPLEIINIKNKKASSSQKEIMSLLKKYVFVSQNKQIYEIENIFYDPISSYSFWKIKAYNLPVRKFESSVKRGDLVFEINSFGDILINNIVAREKRKEILFSDILDNKIILAYQNEKFNNSFVFNSYGDLIALTDKDGKVYSISFFNPLIKNLLKNKKITRPKFGVNYINNFEFLDLETKKVKKGAEIFKNENKVAVVKGSPAEKANLKEGDIIMSINGIELTRDNNLQEIINNYLPGDEIKIDYLREGKQFSVNLRLGSF